jgi:hypothetical protein
MCRFAKKYRLSHKQKVIYRRVAKLLRQKKFALAARIGKRLPCGIRKFIKRTSIKIKRVARKVRRVRRGKKCPK